MLELLEALLPASFLCIFFCSSGGPSLESSWVLDGLSHLLHQIGGGGGRSAARRSLISIVTFAWSNERGVTETILIIIQSRIDLGHLENTANNLKFVVSEATWEINSTLMTLRGTIGEHHYLLRLVLV